MLYVICTLYSMCLAWIVLSSRLDNNNNNNEKDVYCAKLMDAAVAAADAQQTHHTDTIEVCTVHTA